MATYVTKRCPNCGYAYQRHQYGEQRKYGCPFQLCIKCKQTYYDDDIKEPALHGFKNLYEIGASIKRILAILLYGPLSLLLLGGSVYWLIDGNKSAIFLLLMSAFPCWTIGCHIFNKIKEQKNRASIILSQQSEYDESLERLRDTQYLTALAKFDSKAEKVLQARISGRTEVYAKRPQHKQ